jgi:hypothetical protein
MKLRQTLFLCALACGFIFCENTWAQNPGLNVNIILWTTSRCAWFSWQGEQKNKMKLEIEYNRSGQTVTNMYQHGLNGSENARSFFIKQGDVWESKPPATDGTREGHRHNFFAKGGPARRGFFKCDISDIPVDAQIRKATLWHHIHSQEGLKLGSVPPGNYCEWSECPRDWNWDYISWNFYDQGKPWTAPGGDMGRLITRKDREVDLARQGYHKSGILDYPLDISAYVQLLQEERVGKMSPTQIRQAIQSALEDKIQLSPNPFVSEFTVRVNAEIPNAVVSVKVYGASGRVVKMYRAKPGSVAGSKTIRCDMEGCTPGIYLAKIQFMDQQVIKRITLIR